MVCLRGIDNLFLHAYIAKHKLKPRDLNLSQRSYIRNIDQIRLIQQSYRQFIASEKNVEDFFDTQIIKFESSHENRPFTTNTIEVTRSPILLFEMNKNRNRSYYQIGVPMDKIKLTTPIKMSLVNIFEIYGIIDEFNTEDLEGMFVLEDRHRINIHLYLLDENMKGYRNSRVPGTRAIYNTDIYIGMRDDQFYWIQKNLTSRLYYCSRLPGKCCYGTNDLSNLTRHESTCTDQTRITASQVDNLDPLLTNVEFLTITLRKYMAKKKTP